MRKQVQTKAKVVMLKIMAWCLIVLGGILGTVIAIIVLLVMLTVGTVIAGCHTLIFAKRSSLWDVMYSDINKVAYHFRQAFQRLLRR